MSREAIDRGHEWTHAWGDQKGRDGKIFVVLVNSHRVVTRGKDEVAIIVGYANVAELVDALDLGSSAVRCVGSSPSIRTRSSLACPPPSDIEQVIARALPQENSAALGIAMCFVS